MKGFTLHSSLLYIHSKVRLRNPGHVLDGARGRRDGSPTKFIYDEEMKPTDIT